MAHRIKIFHNPKYVRNGLKSYAWLLTKYKFTPTLEGPYKKGSHAHRHGKDGKHAEHENHEHSEHHAHEHAHHKHGHPGKGGQTGQPPAGGSGGTNEGSEVTATDIQTDSEYLCPVTIGTPGQTLMLDFDTGSSDLWVWSTELDAATLQTGKTNKHTIFDPSKSSTFKNLSGNTWQIQYGDNSSASGTVGTDTIKIGSTTITAQAVELAQKLSTEFVQDSGDGLCGLAWGSINTVKPKAVETPVANMITQQDIPQSAELFTAHLGSWRDANDPDKGVSFYTFGELDQPTIQQYGQPTYTPIDNSQGFWMFSSESYTINGKATARAGNKAIADTGTTLLLTGDDVCKAIYAAIPGSKYDSTQGGYLFPTNTTADQLPDIAFPCGDTMIHLQKEYLAFADGGNGMVFGGIQSNGNMGFDILGDIWLKNAYVVFDQGNTRIGVVQRTEPTQNFAAPPAGSGS